jgi:hypothetical protein
LGRYFVVTVTAINDLWAEVESIYPDEDLVWHRSASWLGEA